jgi:putative toxin-antitoxin system antitoxin component (TIGR02293 family)
MAIVKKKNAKAKIPLRKLIVEEPEVAYHTASKNKLWVAYGKTNKESPGESYIKRSLALMGMAAVKPFSDVENVSDFINCIREGVPKQALDNLIDITGITTNEISGIIRTSDRTLRRYTAKQKLNAEQSERVIELAKLYSRGEEVFGSLDAFKEWMNSTVMALGNKKPKEFLDTSLGIEMLMDELGRIEQGIFA